MVQRIDLHSHVIPQNFLDAIAAEPARFQSSVEQRGARRFIVRGSHAVPLDPAFFDADAKVEKMDRLGLDISVLSVGPPAYCYWLPPEAGLAAARLVNDGIAAMAARHPTRLQGMATLPMQDPDAAIAELERTRREHGFRMVETGTSIEGELLAAERFRPVLRTIEQLGMSLFTHPYQCVAHGGMDDYYLRNFIGYPLDTTIMVAHLIFSGALDDCPGLRIVLPHAGGFVPYQIGRFDHGFEVRPEAKQHISKHPTEYRRRFWYDSLAHLPQSVRHLVDTMGADRVVIGTDCPFDMADFDPLASLEQVPGLTDEEREWIHGRSAAALIGGPDAG
jgi:aminocarboxymuconate-semialdehyde decarboxylase